MKALTLWQPWASLVAAGVKRIETRSWRPPAAVIGETIAIHAGMHWTSLMNFPKLWSRGATRSEQEQYNRETIAAIHTITDPAHRRPHRTDIRDRVPRGSQTLTLFWPTEGPHARPPDPVTGNGQISYAPLGVVVATCTLVDVVPIVRDGWPACDPWKPAVVVEDDTLTVYRTHDPELAENADDQLPFGDFTPGRFAWLLDDITPLAAPVPAKGFQKLWEWAA